MRRHSLESCLSQVRTEELALPGCHSDCDEYYTRAIVATLYPFGTYRHAHPTDGLAFLQSPRRGDMDPFLFLHVSCDYCHTPDDSRCRNVVSRGFARTLDVPPFHFGTFCLGTTYTDLQANIARTVISPMETVSNS